MRYHAAGEKGQAGLQDLGASETMVHFIFYKLYSLTDSFKIKNWSDRSFQDKTADQPAYFKIKQPISPIISR